MTNADCIIALGGSPDRNIFGPRVDKAVELYNSGVAPYIIMSGKWWALREIKPEHTEAYYMREYAIDKGVPEEAILTEENSLDTIGNIFFTKRDILEPQGWKNFIIISSDYHEKRVGYIIDKILGPEYTYDFVAVPPTNIPEERVMIYKELEGKSLEKMEKFFGANPLADTRNIKELEQLLFSYHPYYKK